MRGINYIIINGEVVYTKNELEIRISGNNKPEEGVTDGKNDKLHEEWH